MNWLLFLHWYQPADQKPEIVQQVVDQSYRPILQLLKQFPQVKINFNINGCLTEQLAERYPDIVSDLKELVKKGQLELVASAKHHAFLPLLPDQEIIRQIQLGAETNDHYFGKDLYRPQSFFPSEFAYAPGVYRSVRKFKFRSLFVDELSIFGNLGKVDWQKRYVVSKASQHVFLIPINRQWTNYWKHYHEFSFDYFVNQIRDEFNDVNKVLITGLDAELFGHHHKNYMQLLKLAFKTQEIEFITINDYLQTNGENIENVTPTPATWETESTLLNQQNENLNLPYPLWYSRDNIIQTKQWELAWLVIENLAKFTKSNSNSNPRWRFAREYLDLGLSSCYWWWASCQPWWDPDMIIKGTTYLIKSIRSTPASVAKKMAAEKLYLEVVEAVWQWHWSGEAQRRVDEYEKKIGRGLYWIRTQAPSWDNEPW